MKKLKVGFLVDSFFVSKEIFDLVNLAAKNRELKLIQGFNRRAQDLFMNAARAEIVSN